jgi:hypothetical protein
MAPQLKSLDSMQQLVMLRDLSRRFECLHEAQELQLRYWQFCVDPDMDLEACTCTVDFSTKRVGYSWPAGPPLDDAYRARLKLLAWWVSVLLGDDWHTTVSRPNNVVIFEGYGEKPKKPVRRGTAKRARKGRTRAARAARKTTRRTRK